MPAHRQVVTFEEPRIARWLLGSSQPAWIWLIARLWLGWEWLPALGTPWQRGEDVDLRPRLRRRARRREPTGTT